MAFSYNHGEVGTRKMQQMSQINVACSSGDRSKEKQINRNFEKKKKQKTLHYELPNLEKVRTRGGWTVQAKYVHNPSRMQIPPCPNQSPKVEALGELAILSVFQRTEKG